MAVEKGYFMTDEDRRFGQYILDISCRRKTRFQPVDLDTIKSISFPQLELLAADGLVVYDEKGLAVTETGKSFIRNICSAFDLYLQRNNLHNEKRTFSKAI